MKDDRGAVSFVLLAPLVVAVTLMVLQFALWSHASRAAESAARQGASEASLETSNDGQAQAAAMRFISEAAGDLLEDIVVTVQRSDFDVAVTVTANAPGLLPGFSHRVSATSVVPIEVFRTSSGDQ